MAGGAAAAAAGEASPRRSPAGVLQSSSSHQDESAAQRGMVVGARPGRMIDRRAAGAGVPDSPVALGSGRQLDTSCRGAAAAACGWCGVPDASAQLDRFGSVEVAPTQVGGPAARGYEATGNVISGEAAPWQNGIALVVAPWSAPGR
jgi:hypothetical protein